MLETGRLRMPFNVCGPAISSLGKTQTPISTEFAPARDSKPGNPRELTIYALWGTIRTVSKATRFSKSFTVDRSILDYLQRTRSSRSRSERVNELLRRAILDEQYEVLEREAAEFFTAAGKTERAESRAFAAASRRSIVRDGD